MKKTAKIMVCSLLTLLSMQQSIAQEQAKHELSVTGGLGSSSLLFDVDNGQHNSKMGGLVGVGYSYAINNSFAINTGLEMSFYNSEAWLNSFTDSYKATDTEGDFLFNTKVSDYKEKQRSSYLAIPIMGQYQMPVLGDHKFYAAAGTKIGIPVSGSSKTAGAKFATSGTFSDMGNSPVIDDLPGLGFYQFTGKEVERDLDFKVAVMLSLETGMKWNLAPSLSLYTGVYFDYGLNDIRKGDKNDKFLTYEAPYTGVKAEDFGLNSILTSEYTQNNATRSMTGKVRPMALGLKVRLAFALSE